MSARSRRTLRLSVRRVSPPVPGSTPSSGHFRQRHRRAAVVDQHDPVAGQRQLVAAAGRGAADRRQIALAGIGRGVLDREARLVGEFAEIDLVRVRRLGERADIGAGAEHVVLAGADHHRAHLGVLEAQPRHRVGQLDIDAEIVGIELQLGAGKQAAGGIDIERQGRDRPVDSPAANGGSGLDRWRNRSASAARRARLWRRTTIRRIPYCRTDSRERWLPRSPSNTIR